MTSPPYFPHPPRIAGWLISLFAPGEEAESIPGDLLEEYSHLASKSGVAFAQKWYWRQTLKTIAHLYAAGFRVAPWSTVAVVVGGYLLSSFLHGLPDKLLSAVTDRYLSFWSTHFQAYVWVLNGMSITHLILSIFVGCIVALASKGREMIATLTLVLVLSAMVAVAFFGSVAAHWSMDDAPSWVLFQCTDLFAIIVGGVIVRTRRSAPQPGLIKKHY